MTVVPSEIRTLDQSPSLGGLYAKAAIPAIPGLARLTGRGQVTARPPGEPADAVPVLPALEVELPRVGLDASHLARYARVCGFDPRRGVPATYLHVLAFPLHLELMTDATFPFPVLGLVHLSNTITQRRPLTVEEEIDLRVRAAQLDLQHELGRTITLVSEVSVAAQVVWREETVLLQKVTRDRGVAQPPRPAAPTGPMHWRLEGNLGRRYAAVSGDRNPIHLSTMTAKAFGFRRPIAHGMWTKAKALASLEQRVPDAFSVRVDFAKPIYLPGTVWFGARDREEYVELGVTSAPGRTHLVGRLTRQ